MSVCKAYNTTGGTTNGKDSSSQYFIIIDIFYL